MLNLGRIWPVVNGALHLLCQRELTPGATYFIDEQWQEQCAVLGPPLDGDPAFVIVSGKGLTVRTSLTLSGNLVLRDNGSREPSLLSAGGTIVVTGSLVSEGVLLQTDGDLVLAAGSRLQGTGRHIPIGYLYPISFLASEDLTIGDNSAIVIQDFGTNAIHAEFKLVVRSGGSIRLSNISDTAIEASSIDVARGGYISVANSTGSQDGGGISTLYNIHVAAGGRLELQGVSAQGSGGAIDCGTEIIVDGNVEILDAKADLDGGGIRAGIIIVSSSGHLSVQRTEGYVGGALYASAITVNGTITIANSNAEGHGGGMHGEAINMHGDAYFHETRAGKDGGAIIAIMLLHLGGRTVFNNTHAGRSGGGIHAGTWPSVITGEVRFYNATAKNAGGSIYSEGVVEIKVGGNATFNLSRADGANGGGGGSISAVSFIAEGDATFANTSSKRNGGAIDAEQFSVKSSSRVGIYHARSDEAEGGAVFAPYADVLGTLEFRNISTTVRGITSGQAGVTRSSRSSVGLHGGILWF